MLFFRETGDEGVAPRGDFEREGKNGLLADLLVYPCACEGLCHDGPQDDEGQYYRYNSLGSGCVCRSVFALGDDLKEFQRHVLWYSVGSLVWDNTEESDIGEREEDYDECQGAEDVFGKDLLGLLDFGQHIEGLFEPSI